MKIKVKAMADKRIFCLYAALNATVYHRENKKKMHPVRLRVREYLAGKDLNLDGLKQLFEKYPQEFYYRFRDWALSHSIPPSFREINRFWRRNNPKDVKGFTDLMRKFWTHYRMAQLWKEVSPQYERAVKEAQKNGHTALKRTVSYLQMNDLGFDEVIIIPNLLESYNTGFGPKVSRSAYVILGPSQNGFSVTRIQHEILHSVINPLTEPIPDKKKRSYLRECVIRAMVLRMNRENNVYYRSALAGHIRQNYEGIRKWLEELARFETSEESFECYLRGHI